jgi:hypothetical protein
VSLFTLLTVRNGTRNNYGNQSKDHRRDKKHEPVVVVSSDAIIDPRAVVVKAFDTPIANSTVFRPGRAEYFTVRAHLARMDFFE